MKIIPFERPAVLAENTALMTENADFKKALLLAVSFMTWDAYREFRRQLDCSGPCEIIQMPAG